MVSGTAQSVALSASGAPAGVTVSFNPASVTAGGTSTMTVATTAAAATGTATITVSGASASATHTAGFALTVGGSGGGPVLLSQGKPALTWEAAYAKACTIETSADSTTWTKIYSTTTGNGGTDDLTGLSAEQLSIPVDGVCCVGLVRWRWWGLWVGDRVADEGTSAALSATWW